MGARRHILAAMAVVAANLAGCGDGHESLNDPQAIIADLASEDPIYAVTPGMADGLVIVLHGIQGQDATNENIRRGLLKGGVDRAVALISWGSRVPFVGAVVNQVNAVGNRIDGQKVADVVVAYQHRYPGRPVHIVGHSGGAGIAVFAAERLPAGHKVDGLVLLSASISSTYDLTPAMEHTTYGIVNVYNRDDGGLLSVGTTVMGTVDGTHGPSAGLMGFDRPLANDDPDRLRAYRRLFQINATGMASPFGIAHLASTEPDFISATVTPWLLSCSWPPPHKQP
ncbi:MAG: alpha/beta fold hydrolase [Planctomycetota bacterium]|nr:alpha/beta fold hydrolase [Planctomycetota bacterium]